MKYSFPAFENGFVRAAAATPALHVADCAYNAQQIIDAMSVYAAQGVQLVCFPEFCLTGYTCSDLFLQQTVHRVRGAGNAHRHAAAFQLLAAEKLCAGRRSV